MKRWPLCVLFFAVFLFPISSHAQTPQFSISVDNVLGPDICTTSGWTITYDRTTISTDTSDQIMGMDTSALTSYVVQYVNDDINLVHYWGSGYSGYVQDYMVATGTKTSARAGGYYAIPLASDTYQAETIEYIVLMDGPFNIVAAADEDQVIWEVRASLTCEDGLVTAYEISSSFARDTRGNLPQFTQNLVLALDDVKLYTNPYAHRGYLGTIRACQTFFVTDIWMPRASITTMIHESLTDHDVPLVPDMPFVDVPDNYGQPGAAQIEACPE